MLSFIVLSSDGYSDCWNPFFELFEKRFPKIEDIEIILSTNTKQYTYKNLNIKVITHGNDFPWSKRLRICLDQAKHSIVLPLSEDFLLRSKVDKDVFVKVLDLITNQNDIDHIRLLRAPVYKTEKSKYLLLDKISTNTKKRFLLSPGLWKKEVLKKYINNRENPWIVEKMGDFRAKIYKHQFYCISKEYVDKHGQLYDANFSGVIYKGKCAYYVVSFLEKEGYTDILKRGIMDKDDMKKIKSKAKRTLLQNFPSILRSFMGISALYFKEKFKK